MNDMGSLANGKSSAKCARHDVMLEAQFRRGNDAAPAPESKLVDNPRYALHNPLRTLGIHQ